MLTEEQKKRCLQYNPFEGEFGEGEVKLSDKIVLAKKDSLCWHCCGTAYAGTNHRVIAEAADGEIYRTRICEDCCAAMALSWDDDGAAAGGG